MTALAIKTKSFLSRILESIQKSQQAKAEYEVAKMLHKEYKKEPFDYVLHKVREGKVSELL